MFERELIRVMLCCNDPDNGIFDGHLSALEIGPNMSFSSTQWKGPRLAYLGGDGRTFGHARVRIAGKVFPICGYRNWVGNWCWDCVTMRGETVIELLNWPRFSQFFDIDEGEERLFNWFKARRPWSDNDLRLIGKDFDRLSTGGGT